MPANDDLDDDIYGFTPSEPIRFQPIPWAEFANIGDYNWIVDDVIPQAELAVIFGAPGSGKTFMALDMAMSIARGIQWEHKDVQQGRIVYLAAEAAYGFKKRLKAYEIHHKITGNIIPFDVIADAPNFLLTIDTAAIIQQIGKATVVVVDTFSRTMPGGNENGGEDVGMAISQCRELHKASGAIVILIHHSGKDAARGARGWSGLLGACDTEIEITRIGDHRKGRISKQKDGDDEFEWGFKLNQIDIGLNKKGKMITSCVYQSTNAIPLEEKKDRPLGTTEQLVYDAFRLLDVYSVDIEEIIETVKKSIAYDKAKADRRRDSIIRALNSLKSRKLIDLVDGHVCKC